MVIGLKTKSRRSPTVHVDYLIHIQEIKPWPPTQSLKTLRSVLIQWENGDRSSGSTNAVIPSLGSGIGDGKIEFNESFKLSVILLREMSIKAGDSDTFQKNCLEFNLYEPRRDKTVKGQLLGTAIIDLADYGVVKETLSMSAPVNCKRNFRNTAQPILYIKIQQVNKGRTNSLARDILTKETSLDKNGGESVSALMNEEYAEEAELTSCTDDDVSSHSSLNVLSSAHESNGVLLHQNQEKSTEMVKDGRGSAIKELTLPSKPGVGQLDTMSLTAMHENQKENSSCSSSMDLSSDPESPVNGHGSSSNLSESSVMSIQEEIVAPSVESSSSSITEKECKTSMGSNGSEDFDRKLHDKVTYSKSKVGTHAQLSIEENTSDTSFVKIASANVDSQAVEKLGSTSFGHSQVNGEDERFWRPGRNDVDEAANGNDIHDCPVGDKNGDKEQENELGNHILDEKKHTREDAHAPANQVSSRCDTLSYNRVNLGMKSNTLIINRLRHVKSVRSLSDSGKSNGVGTVGRGNQSLEEVVSGIVGDAQNASRILSSESKDSKVNSKETKSTLSNSKIQQLEHRIIMLEGELRDAAAVEVALYSVVAEHGSSMNKVHAPARRLSRLYLHACKEKSLSRRASAARTAVSGLALAAKACGNDVPRLTFWLSNSVVLRVIISKGIVDSKLQRSSGHSIEKTRDEKINSKKSPPLKWESSASIMESNKALTERIDDWVDPHAFTSALENIEAWIFSRIIESVWWQTLTPHMQSAAAKEIDGVVGSSSSKIYRRMSSTGDQEKGNLSLDLWKKAFKDACERLCPVRAAGHECGCLPVLARLIMEQCVARLDVAMFNAILRESADEIPTDPVSDPISDSNVLPIPAGRFSFGAGAQLKNAIGNWSRWLTDLFGLDDEGSFGDETDRNNDDERRDTSFKTFHLLNALSDLMMLPKDMLLSRSIRKEVCPAFGSPLIKRVINSFVPDEFCPDQIPEVVLEALDSEDSLENEEEFVTNYPCSAAPTVYLRPSNASIESIIGEIGSPQLRRTGSSVLRKSYTSDDELDELDSPLNCIFMDSLRSSSRPTKNNWMTKQHGSQNAIRYQLLREVWMDSV